MAFNSTIVGPRYIRTDFGDEAAIQANQTMILESFLPPQQITVLGENADSADDDPALSFLAPVLVEPVLPPIDLEYGSRYSYRANRPPNAQPVDVARSWR